MTQWAVKLDIKQYLSDDTSNEAVRIASGKILAELKAKLPKIWLNGNSQYLSHELLDILDDLECMSSDTDVTCGDFNFVLSELYDWADYKRVWLGL